MNRNQVALSIGIQWRIASEYAGNLDPTREGHLLAMPPQVERRFYCFPIESWQGLSKTKKQQFGKKDILDKYA